MANDATTASHPSAASNPPCVQGYPCPSWCEEPADHRFEVEPNGAGVDLTRWHTKEVAAFPLGGARASVTVQQLEITARNDGGGEERIPSPVEVYLDLPVSHEGWSPDDAVTIAQALVQGALVAAKAALS